MKRSLSVIALGLCLLTGAPATGWAQQNVIAGKQQVTREIKVGAFSKLQVNGCFNIVYTPTEHTQSVKLHIPENIEKLLQVRVENHTLVVDMALGKSVTLLGNKCIELQVAAPMVESVVINGAGNVQFTSDCCIPQLEWIINGMGKISAQKVDCNAFRVTINGNSEISLTQVNSPQVETVINGCGSLEIGRVDATNLQAEVMGNGEMNLSKIVAVNTHLTIHGAGELTATDINANLSKNTVNGNGSLRIKRLVATKVDNELGGAGDIRMEQVKAALLNAQLHSIGNLKLQGLDVQKVNVTVAGGGEVELKGKAEKGQYLMLGSGSIQASSLKSQNAEATARSSYGTIHCQATNQLIINELKNSHSVKVKGKPQEIKRNILN